MDETGTGVGAYVGGGKEGTTVREKWLGPPSHLSSLSGNTEQASAPQFLRVPFFSLSEE